MAYVTPYTFVALQTLTAAQLNAIQTNITALWPYTSAGDISYASAANTLARLAKGTAGQVLKMNAGETAPEWGVGGSYQLIEEHIVTEATEANITFSSIPATFNHLILFGQIRSNYATLGDNLLVRFNSDSGANYDYVAVITGSVDQYVAGGTSALIATVPGSSASASIVMTFEAKIPFYAKTNWYKNILSNSGKMPDTTSTHFEFRAVSNQWRSTNAINAIEIRLNSGQIVQNSIASLYGVT
jgi:hypothetical protein